MCTTAFFGFLCVGEIICCPRSPAVLQLDQVVRELDNIGNIAGFKLTFTNFKHSDNQRAVSITLHRRYDLNLFKAVCDELGIDKVYSTPYHPEANGQVERQNRSVNQSHSSCK